jgi:hypothetical protein
VVLSAGNREGGSALLIKDWKAQMSLTMDTLAFGDRAFLTGSDRFGTPAMVFHNKEGETIYKAP